MSLQKKRGFMVVKTINTLCFEVTSLENELEKKNNMDLCQHANKYKQVVLETIS